MKDFNGKVAVITGAGRGIGRGIALRCAEEGMKVVLAGYGMESITKTAADLQALGAETLVIQADVSKEEDVENLAQMSFDKFGEVHLLVNNAGVVSPGSIIETTMDDWNWVLGVNFYGVLYGLRAFVPRMKQQAEGHIVNVSSMAGVTPGNGVYAVSKHAVVALSESLYGELLDSPVNVTVYCPAYVTTELDNAERSRPARFADSSTDRLTTDADREDLRNRLDRGFSIEKSANVLFEGIQENKFYVGIQAFTEQFPDLPDWVRNRSEAIINDANPDIPLIPPPGND